MVAEVFRYYAGWATKIFGETHPGLRAGAFKYTLREPVGVVGAITPWNFPLLLASWKIAPALAVGQHGRPQARGADAADRAQARRARARGGPAAGRVQRGHRPGLGRRRRDGAPPRRRQDRLHGLDRGRPRRSCATRPGTLKRVSLELGGKSPNIVFADADLEAAVKGAVERDLLRQGRGLRRRLAAARRGSRSTTSSWRSSRRASRRSSGRRPDGPEDAARRRSSRRSSSRRVERYVAAGQKDGATLVAGGERADDRHRQGLLLRAHHLHRRHERDDDRRARRSSGPSSPVIKFDDEAEAIRKANDTPFGLAGRRVVAQHREGPPRRRRPDQGRHHLGQHLQHV